MVSARSVAGVHQMPHARNFAMVTDDGAQIRRKAPFSRFRRQRGSAIPLVVLTLSVALAATAFPLLLVSQGQEPPRNDADGKNQFRPGDGLFTKWPKPDVAIMISGQ